MTKPNPKRAADILGTINRHTVATLIKEFKKTTLSLDELDLSLENARKERNRFFHSFYRQHNFRRNLVEARDRLLYAYKTVMLLSGVDLEALAATGEHIGPIGHLPI